uniref:Uncharacterized protein n=1 Tax=Magallana gigas TaxID=29159 RepID=A0A8W8JMC0_MAGGI|nr:uncharacterized protein LOC117692048 [Crassostrea gigas]
MRIVKKCPENEEKWREAAARMNCTIYANQCDEPERLVYHCVINTFVNQTLEVCAYAQNILQGHCTEYNIRGNIIQPNVRTNCKAFSQNPCPQLYNSTEAYKYQGCYELTRELSTNSQQTEYGIKQNVETSSLKKGHENLSINEDTHGGSSNSVVKIIVVGVYAMILSVVAVAAFGLYLKRRSR